MSSEWPAPFQPVGGPPPPPPPASSPAPPPAPRGGGLSNLAWFAAGGLVVAGIVAVVVVVLNVCPGCLGQPTAAPSATASQVAVGSPTPGRSTAAPGTSTPAASGATASPPTSGSPSPPGNVPPDIAADIEAVIEQMPAIRELEQLRDVPYYLITRAQFQADLEVLLEENIDFDVLAAQQRLLQRIGLLDDDADLKELVLELNGAAAGAYYRFDDRSMYIIERDEPFGALDRVFVAHEFTHALQDQHFDIVGTRISDPSEGDAAQAQLAIQEGDASTAMLAWAQANLSFEELFEMLSSSLTGTDPELLARMPPILTRQLEFPYADGMNFVSQVQLQGGWAAVDELLAEPPPSTEQIMHADKFAAREPPVDVDLPDVSADLGEGWSRSYVDTMGELNMQVFMAGDEIPTATLPGLPVEWPYAEAWTGWGGDRVALWEGPDGDWAVAWLTAWDSPTDADEFAVRLADLQPRFDGTTAVVRDEPQQVLVLLAVDDETRNALATALGE